MTMLEGYPSPDPHETVSLWRIVAKFEGMAYFFQTEESNPHLQKLLSSWLPKQAAACQRYGTFFAGANFLGSRGKKYKTLRLMVASAQSLLLGPAAQLLDMYTDGSQQLQLADAIEGSSDLADAALAHLLGFCQHSYCKWQLGAGAPPGSAGSSSSSGGSSTLNSTSHSSKSTGRGRKGSGDTDESSCGASGGGSFSSSKGGVSCSSSSSSSSSRSSSKAEGGGGSFSSSKAGGAAGNRSSSNNKALDSSTRPAPDAVLQLLPDHDMVVVPEPVRALAAGHADSLVEAPPHHMFLGWRPSSLLSASLRVLSGRRHHSPGQQEAASSSATSSSSANQTAAAPATLLPLLLEAVALLDELNLQIKCLQLMAKAAREASRPEAHAFLKERGPLLLQVLWQLASKTNRAEQQQESSQEHNQLQYLLACASVQLLSGLVNTFDEGVCTSDTGQPD